MLKSVLLHQRREIVSRVAFSCSHELFGRTGKDEFSPSVSPFGAEVDDVIGRFDDIEIVLNDHERMSTF